ncbi:DUF3592 domain-containing protein [Haloplanus rallus]|jgi:hypothetical protein|uniref:DUF3592 domain-containing protein n=1 Tax=Haloplanus rallus TaxID=1816183 RepID=A0A6B9FD95_9EURY|nr:DUF3592 domain-containing protein [Haloplanus rallus]QGX93899.1 DUF3592 domain-containing protein [Haloplanus rallus]
MTESSSFSIDGPDTLRGALILFIVGLGITGYGAYDYVQQSDAMRNAAEVDATITEVDVVTESSVGGAAGGEISYEPRVEFRYKYQGTTYTGTNVFPADINPEYDKSNAEAVIDEYEEGESVTAYVDSTDPDHAFLKNKTSNQPLIAAGIGAMISVLGAVSALKKYRTN